MKNSRKYAPDFFATYSPELNPVEHLWDELREKAFWNRVFDSLDALENHKVSLVHVVF